MKTRTSFHAKGYNKSLSDEDTLEVNKNLKP